MDYLARCTNDNCANFKGDSGSVWVKIGQLAYNPKASGQPWASDFLRERGAKWDVTIPSSLAPGSYLLRHEILGLHVAGSRFGAQFYPSCTQIKIVKGGSTTLPSGVALPGAYNPDDTKGVSDSTLHNCIYASSDTRCRSSSNFGGSTRARSRTPHREGVSGAVQRLTPTELDPELRLV